MQNTNRKTPESSLRLNWRRATGRPLSEVEAWIEAGAIRPLPVGDGITCCRIRSAQPAAPCSTAP
jgi:hypothetical protein